MSARDARMRAISEAFSSILAIKLNAWENQFLKKILKDRDIELVYIWRVLLFQSISTFLLWMAPCLVSVTTISVFTVV